METVHTFYTSPPSVLRNVKLPIIENCIFSIGFLNIIIVSWTLSLAVPYLLIHQIYIWPFILSLRIMKLHKKYERERERDTPGLQAPFSFLNDNT